MPRLLLFKTALGPASKYQFQSELNLSRCSRGATYFPKIAIRYGRVRLAQISVIEYIEKLGTELQI